MRSSTVIFSSRRNSLKRESETDLLRRAARDADLGFLVADIEKEPKPARWIRSIRDSSPFRKSRVPKQAGSKNDNPPLEM
jgi:hypothetical protein